VSGLIRTQYTDMFVRDPIVNAVIFGLAKHLEGNSALATLNVEVIDFLFVGESVKEIEGNSSVTHRFYEARNELRIDIKFTRRIFGPRKRGERSFRSHVVLDKIAELMISAFEQFLSRHCNNEKKAGALMEIAHEIEKFRSDFDAQSSPWLKAR